MAENAIEIHSLVKDYKSRRAVDGLDLSVKRGEFFALLGPNGAGKTTTIKMLCCLLTPTDGDALVCGRSIVREAEEVKKLINLSPQETAVAARLSVKENLELIARLYGDDKQTAQRKAAEAMQRFGLSDRANDRAKALSGGLQRSLSLAMALITDPEVVFLDEPTLGLDVRARRALWKTLTELKGEKTVILTTHYLEEAEALSDRIGIMYGGSLRALGTADEIKSLAGADSFEDAFLALTDGGDAE